MFKHIIYLYKRFFFLLNKNLSFDFFFYLTGWCFIGFGLFCLIWFYKYNITSFYIYDISSLNEPFFAKDYIFIVIDLIFDLFFYFFSKIAFFVYFVFDISNFFVFPFNNSEILIPFVLLILIILLFYFCYFILYFVKNFIFFSFRFFYVLLRYLFFIFYYFFFSFFERELFEWEESSFFSRTSNDTETILNDYGTTHIFNRYDVVETGPFYYNWFSFFEGFFFKTNQNFIFKTINKEFFFFFLEYFFVSFFRLIFLFFYYSLFFFYKGILSLIFKVELFFYFYFLFFFFFSFLKSNFFIYYLFKLISFLLRQFVYLTQYLRTFLIFDFIFGFYNENYEELFWNFRYKGRDPLAISLSLEFFSEHSEIIKESPNKVNYYEDFFWTFRVISDFFLLMVLGRLYRLDYWFFWSPVDLLDKRYYIPMYKDIDFLYKDIDLESNSIFYKEIILEIEEGLFLKNNMFFFDLEKYSNVDLSFLKYQAYPSDKKLDFFKGYLFRMEEKPKIMSFKIIFSVHLDLFEKFYLDNNLFECDRINYINNSSLIGNNKDFKSFQYEVDNLINESRVSINYNENDFINSTVLNYNDNNFHKYSDVKDLGDNFKKEKKNRKDFLNDLEKVDIFEEYIDNENLFEYDTDIKYDFDDLFEREIRNEGFYLREDFFPKIDKEYNAKGFDLNYNDFFYKQSSFFERSEDFVFFSFFPNFRDYFSWKKDQDQFLDTYPNILGYFNNVFFNKNKFILDFFYYHFSLKFWLKKFFIFNLIFLFFYFLIFLIFYICYRIKIFSYLFFRFQFYFFRSLGYLFFNRFFYFFFKLICFFVFLFFYSLTFFNIYVLFSFFFNFFIYIFFFFKSFFIFFFRLLYFIFYLIYSYRFFFICFFIFLMCGPIVSLNFINYFLFSFLYYFISFFFYFDFLLETNILESLKVLFFQFINFFYMKFIIVENFFSKLLALFHLNDSDIYRMRIGFFGFYFDQYIKNLFSINLLDLFFSLIKQVPTNLKHIYYSDYRKIYFDFNIKSINYSFFDTDFYRKDYIRAFNLKSNCFQIFFEINFNIFSIIYLFFKTFFFYFYIYYFKFIYLLLVYIFFFFDFIMLYFILRISYLIVFFFWFYHFFKILFIALFFNLYDLTLFYLYFFFVYYLFGFLNVDKLFFVFFYSFFDIFNGPFFFFLIKVFLFFFSDYYYYYCFLWESSHLFDLFNLIYLYIWYVVDFIFNPLNFYFYYLKFKIFTFDFLSIRFSDFFFVKNDSLWSSSKDWTINNYNKSQSGFLKDGDNISWSLYKPLYSFFSKETFSKMGLSNYKEAPYDPLDDLTDDLKESVLKSKSNLMFFDSKERTFNNKMFADIEIFKRDKLLNLVSNIESTSSFISFIDLKRSFYNHLYDLFPYEKIEFYHEESNAFKGFDKGYQNRLIKFIKKYASFDKMPGHFFWNDNYLINKDSIFFLFFEFFKYRIKGFISDFAFFHCHWEDFVMGIYVDVYYNYAYLSFDYIVSSWSGIFSLGSMFFDNFKFDLIFRILSENEDEKFEVFLNFFYKSTVNEFFYIKDLNSLFFSLNIFADTYLNYFNDAFEYYPIFSSIYLKDDMHSYFENNLWSNLYNFIILENCHFLYLDYVNLEFEIEKEVFFFKSQSMWQFFNYLIFNIFFSDKLNFNSFNNFTYLPDDRYNYHFWFEQSTIFDWNLLRIFYNNNAFYSKIYLGLNDLLFFFENFFIRKSVPFYFWFIYLIFFFFFFFKFFFV